MRLLLALCMGTQGRSTLKEFAEPRCFLLKKSRPNAEAKSAARRGRNFASFLDLLLLRNRQGRLVATRLGGSGAPVLSSAREL